MSVATATQTRTSITKWKLGEMRAADAFSSMSCKYVAGRPESCNTVHFPEERKWVTTANEWRLGWDPSRKAWVAANNCASGWRFKDLAAMQAFRSFLEGKNWAVSRA